MSAKPFDAKQVPLSKADKLRTDAAEAAQVRAFLTHPDVVALRTEKVRTQVDGMIWAGLLLGLAFTMVNVQQFAAHGAAVFSLAWCAAWLLDPMVSLVLVAVLRAEQITARYQVEMRGWVTHTKRFAFAATYVMNTWQSWASLRPEGIVLHSVPPVLVYCAAEAGPVLRDRLTEAVVRAGRGATSPGHVEVGHRGGDGDDTSTGDIARPVDREATESLQVDPKPVKTLKSPAKRKTSKKPAPRKLLADFVGEARAAHTPGVEITPAWVREVTDCARGTSKNVADALNAELSTTPSAAPLAAVQVDEQEAA